MKKRLLDYKIKNRYLIYMIMFSYVFGSFLGLIAHNVNATVIINATIGTGDYGFDYSQRDIYRLTNGTLVTVFTNSIGANKLETYMSFDNGSTWIKQNSLTTTLLNTYPSMLIRANNNMSIYYKDSGDIIQMRWYNYISKTYSGETAISGISNAFDPSVCSDPSGNIHVIYSSSFGHGIYYNMYNNVTKTWGSMVTVATGAYYQYQYGHNIVSDSLGNVHLIWSGKTISSPNNWNLRYCYKNSGGTWSPIAEVTTGITDKILPSIAVSDGDVLYISYLNNDSGLSGHFNVFYCKSVSYSSFSMFTAITSITHPYLNRANSISVDKNNTVHIVYIGNNSGNTLQQVYHCSLKDDSIIENIRLTTTGGYSSISSIHAGFGNNKNIIGDGYAFIYRAGSTNYYYSYVYNWEYTTYVNNEDLYCSYDMSSYAKRKSFHTENPSNDVLYTSYKYLEMITLSKYTTTVKGVILYISDYQYTHISYNLSDYELYINGISQNTPDCFKLIGNGNNYALFWNINKDIDNSQIRLSFSCSKNYGGTYWAVPYSYYSEVSNFLKSRYHNNVVFFTDNIFNGNNIILSGYPVMLNSAFFILTQTVQNETSPFDDSISTLKTTYTQYKNIQILYTINSTKAGYYKSSIHIYRNGTEITEQIFPYTINDNVYSGITGFVPVTIGTYRFNLVRNNVNITYCQATVTDNLNDDYVIYLYPNPSLKHSIVYVGYRYFNPEGYDGRIAFECGSFPDFHTGELVKTVLSNTSGEFALGSFDCIDYGICGLYTAIPTIDGYNYYLMAYDTYKSYSGSFGVNEINAKITEINYTDTFNELITGQEHYAQFGYDTYITKNGKRIFTLTGNYIDDVTSIKDPENYTNVFFNGDFSFFDKITKIGTYNYSLKVNFGGTTITLDYVIVTVDLSEGGGSTDSLFLIPAPWCYFAGTFVIILLTITPLIFGYIFKVSLDNIPQFLYLVFALIGFIVSLVLGFFPLWSIIILVLVGGLIVAIMWLKNNNNSA